MAPSPLDRLAARSITHGGIAGAVIGPVAAVIIVLLSIPFLLRVFRHVSHRTHADNIPPNMGMAGPPPVGPVPSYPVAGPPVYDSNSLEDGKAHTSYSPSTAASGSASGCPARQPGGPPVNTNMPPGGPGPVSPFPPPQGPPPSQYPPPGPLHQRSPTEQSTTPSLTQTITSLFRRSNTQTSLSPSISRSPVEGTRSPVDMGYGDFNPGHNPAWMGAGPADYPHMPSGGYPPNDYGPGGYPQAGYPQTGYPQTGYPQASYPPSGYPAADFPGPGYPGGDFPPMGYPSEYPNAEAGIYSVDEQHLTGASAEYYSGAPLSPPSDAGAPTEPSHDAAALPESALTNLVSMSHAAAAAMVPSGVKDPKLTAIRTDSMRSNTAAVDFSPLSPTSPPRTSGERGVGYDAVSAAEHDAGHKPTTPAAAATPAGSQSQALQATALTPEPVEFMPLSPSFRPLVPSPRLPAPGTVNPRDVWAPATEDERFVHVTAELDRIEQSPPPPPALATDKSIASVIDQDGSDGISTAVPTAAPSPEATTPEALSAVSAQHAPSPHVTVTPPGAQQPASSEEDEASQMVKTESQYGHTVTSFANDPPVVDMLQYDDPYTASQAGYLDGGLDSSMSTGPFLFETSQAASDSAPMGAETYALGSLSSSMQHGKPPVELFATPSTTASQSVGSSPPQQQQPFLYMPQYGLGPPVSLANGQAAATSPLMPPLMPPMTPPRPLLPLSNFNTPLAVPTVEHGPTSPVSNMGSTPGRISSSASPHSFTCDECGREFDQIHKLNHHRRYHERPHVCTVANCGKKFGTKTHLDRHINDKHSKSRKYHCTEEGCPYSVPGGKSFPRKDNWRRHMVNKHGVHPDHDPIEVVDQPMAGM